MLSELVDLPLAKRNESRKDWYYACSFAQWANVIAEGEDAYSKRFDLANAANFIDFKNKVGKVDTTRGEYKNYRNILFYWHALYIDWYAVGVKEEVEKILRFCTHIGKKAAQGISIPEWYD
ncbi:MAG: hypothetical protein NZM34_13785 [Bernardetiaceae bacterium]|nr:hypothetical protein [Bernardetiaceae bacterium]